MNLNARSAARLLCVPEERIFDWVTQGAIPSYRVQEQLRFDRVELLEWAAARRMRVAPELFEDERRGTAGASLRLSSALAAGGIYRDVAARDEATALRAVITLLTLPAGVDREAFAELFAARGGVTPVGGGVAVPHARAPAILPGRAPIVALAFLERPIDLQAPDGKPVGALFAVLTPTIRVHLDILSKLALALSTPDFHALIDQKARNEDILDRLTSLEASPDRPPPSLLESGSI